MDVLAVFKEGEKWPHPIKFTVKEDGEEKTVDVGEVLGVKDVGAGGVARAEYTCTSMGARGKIKYLLIYYYRRGAWELKRI